MFGQTYYHKTLRKYVSLFGTLFNDIYINRTDLENNDIQTLKVPITYGPKNKGLARLNSDPKLNRPFEVLSPVISFEMTGMTYAAERKLNTVRKHCVKVDDANSEKMQYAYNPVPYDLNFSLYVYTKYAEDGTRVLEQILPFFQPDYTVTVNVVPALNIKRDIPIILNSLSYEDSYSGDFTTRRAVIYTLNFTAKTYLFGPMSNQGVIKTVQSDIYTDTNTTTAKREERIVVVPDPTTADADDDFGFTTTITSYTDSKKYNPVTDTDV